MNMLSYFLLFYLFGVSTLSNSVTVPAERWLCPQALLRVVLPALQEGGCVLGRGEAAQAMAAGCCACLGGGLVWLPLSASIQQSACDTYQLPSLGRVNCKAGKPVFRVSQVLQN